MNNKTIETMIPGIRENIPGLALMSDTDAAVAIITGIIQTLVADTKEDKGYNAHTLATDALKIARRVIKDFPGVRFIPGEPNAKTGIRSIDLLPFITCHKRCLKTCGAIARGRKFNKGKCYAFKLMYRNPITCARYAVNTALLLDNPVVFWEGVEMLMKGERFLRCFVAGDANIGNFFENLFDIAVRAPHCEIQGFTKCWEQINAYIDKRGKLPDNVHFLLSGWDAMKPDNPHNLPVSDVYDTDLPTGWLACGNDCRNCACVGLGCWKAGAGDVVGLKKH